MNTHERSILPKDSYSRGGLILRSGSRCSTKSRCHNAAREVIVSESMTLTQFTERHYKDLPLQIKVLRGYCGSTSRLTISADDTYNVHFVKRVKVVHVLDVHNQRYSVPINSCVEFCMLYDHKNQGKSENNDFKIASVLDIMQLTPLPKVICVLKSWKGDDVTSSVVENEVLIVKQVHKSKYKHRKFLKVYSITSKLEKTLPEECCGEFSTEPYHNHVLVGDLLEHSPDPLPCAALLYLNADVYATPRTSIYARDLPEELLSKPVTLVDMVVETSLVSSPVLLEDTSHLDKCAEDIEGKYVDIPLEGGLLQIEVALVDIHHAENLYDDTRNIYEKYSPRRVTTFCDVASNQGYSAQSFFYSAVRSDCETLGVQLDEPSSIYEPLKRASLSKGIVRANQVSNSQGDQEMNPCPPLPAKRHRSRLKSDSEQSSHVLSTNKLEGNNESKSLSKGPPAIPLKPGGQSRCTKNDSAICPRVTESNYYDTDAQSQDISTESTGHSFTESGALSSFSDLNIRISSYEKRMECLESKFKNSEQCQGIEMKDMEKLKNLTEHLSARLSSLEQQLHVLVDGSRQSHNVPSPAKTSDVSSTSSTNVYYDRKNSSTDANMGYLASLTVADVTRLLKKMGLMQYTEVFAREQISGEIMMDIDDDILKDELGITSKLHRIRLMKVAKGQHSAFNLLTESNL